MKTPREVLLARHQTANPKLDSIRQSVVADLSPASREPELPFLLKLWHELILPCRYVWGGLAAVWLALLIFNSSQADRPQVILATAPSPAVEMRMAFREQQRVLNEIIGDDKPAAPAEPPRQINNRPRTENSATAMA